MAAIKLMPTSTPSLIFVLLLLTISGLVSAMDTTEVGVEAFREIIDTFVKLQVECCKDLEEVFLKAQQRYSYLHPEALRAAVKKSFYSVSASKQPTKVNSSEFTV